MKHPLGAKCTFVFVATHLQKKIISRCMKPSKPTHKGRRVTCEKQDNTHQALSEFHRTIKGRRRERPRLSQYKRGGTKKIKNNAGMDEGRGDFKAPFSSPCYRCRLLLASSLPYLWFSSSFSP